VEAVAALVQLYLPVLGLQTQAAVAVALVTLLILLAVRVALVLLSFVISAHSAALAEP
jgi:hypothetical protein